MLAHVARTTCRSVLVTILAIVTSPAVAQHQTDTFTPVNVGSSQPWQVSLRRYDFGAADKPTLQSFAAGMYDGKWVMLAGRTNGIHGFGQSGSQNFPPAAQNKEVWVVDPVTKQTWRRSLATDTGITPMQLAHLSSTNTQFAQVGSRLYITGGYASGPAGFQTYNFLSSIDLPKLTDWVMNGTGTATGAIRSINDEGFRVTGGAMYPMNGRMHLVFGQNFTGGYPGGSGVYTQQVRSFDIIDDGTNLSIENYSATTPDPNYRRRDLNVYPVVHRNTTGGLDIGVEALSGVFTLSNGAWTVPVYVNDSGQASMRDPAAPNAFKQAMNNYHSAKLGLYSEQADSMHEVLFGGITLHYYDENTQSFVRDDGLPFTNQITQVNKDSDGNYTQDLIGEFPVLLDQQGNRLRFGAGAEFFPADGVPTYDNGVIQLDALMGPTVLGYVYGGIFANAPHTQGVTGAVSGASNEIFEVIYTPVPEPGAAAATVLALVVVCLSRRHRRAS
jgi:hypothetical protein